MPDLFRLSDVQRVETEPLTPTNRPEPEREHDRRIISGFLPVLTSGYCRRDYPAAYGPHTKVCNRFDRVSRRCFRRAMLAALARAEWSREVATIDATEVKVHRSSQGG